MLNEQIVSDLVSWLRKEQLFVFDEVAIKVVDALLDGNAFFFPVGIQGCSGSGKITLANCIHDFLSARDIPTRVIEPPLSDDNYMQTVYIVRLYRADIWLTGLRLGAAMYIARDRIRRKKKLHHV